MLPVEGFKVRVEVVALHARARVGRRPQLHRVGGHHHELDAVTQSADHAHSCTTQKKYLNKC